MLTEVVGVTRHIAGFRFLIAATGLALVSGLTGVGYAVHRWTAAPIHCHYGGHPPHGRPPTNCTIFLVSGWGPTAWTAFGLGLGALAVGACFFVLARRIKPERSARLVPG